MTRRRLSWRSLTAADLMRRDVVVVGPNDSLLDALELMTENHVSGLPVLDARDKCVGVISATDILTFEQEQSERTAEQDGFSAFFDPQAQRWVAVRVRAGLEELADVRVREVMSRELVAVRPNTPVKKVAQRMVESDVRRVLVLDDQQFLHGIISSMDFVRLLVEL